MQRCLQGGFAKLFTLWFYSKPLLLNSFILYIPYKRWCYFNFYCFSISAIIIIILLMLLPYFFKECLKSYFFLKKPKNILKGFEATASPSIKFNGFYIQQSSSSCRQQSFSQTANGVSMQIIFWLIFFGKMQQKAASVWKSKNINVIYKLLFCFWGGGYNFKAIHQSVSFERFFSFTYSMSRCHYSNEHLIVTPDIVDFILNCMWN